MHLQGNLIIHYDFYAQTNICQAFILLATRTRLWCLHKHALHLVHWITPSPVTCPEILNCSLTGCKTLSDSHAKAINSYWRVQA